MTSSVVIALDSFKGSIGAADACAALAEGWRDAEPGARILMRPMADGGEGTLDAFAAAVPAARRMPVTVTGPDGSLVEASWLLLPATADAPGETGVVELACTSGIELLGPPRLPHDAHTIGFGQAVAAALHHGVTRLVLGIGSSASTDGGAGVLEALGARLLDGDGIPVARGLRGLADIRSVDVTALPALPTEGAVVLSDVTSPLTGPDGAAAVFGPQKGLTVDEIAGADAVLAHYAGQVQAVLPGADPSAPGSGAAGGTGFALQAWGAVSTQGAARVAELIGLPDALAEASVVVTGEGSFDGQSAAGKAPAQVAALARAAHVRAALVAGRVTADTSGFAAAVSLTELAGSGREALADPARWLRAAGAALAVRLR